MSDSPRHRVEKLTDGGLNRKSISMLPRHSHSVTGTPSSSSSRTPLRNIRRRSMDSAFTEYDSNLGPATSIKVFPLGTSGDSKENTNIYSNLSSPSSVDTDKPIHPLRFSTEEQTIQRNDLYLIPSSRCKSSPEQYSEDPLSVSNVQRSKTTNTSDVSSIIRSPSKRFLSTESSQYQSLSDSKIIKRNNSHGRRVESSLRLRGTPSLSRKKRSIQDKDISDASSEKSSLSDFRETKNLTKAAIFPSNSNDMFDSANLLNFIEYNDTFKQRTTCNQSESELHALCSCMTTIDELMKAQSLLHGISLQKASERDYKGETLLHRFSNNKTLAVIIGNPNNEDYETKDFLTLYRQPSIDQKSADQLNRLTECFFVDNLLPSFFGAPMAQDNDGQIPFEAGLIDWVATCHKEMYGQSLQSGMGYFSAYTNKVSDVVTYAWESTSTTLLSAMPFGKTTSKPNRQGVVESDIERGDSMSSAESTTSELFGKSKFTPHARFCLRMLSLILDEFDKFTEGFKNINMNRQMQKYSRAIKGIQQLKNVTGPFDLCGRIVEKVASIPHLLEVIFSINNDSDLQYVLSTKIIKRVLIDKHSVGPWLTSMLRSPQRQISKRAIDYLQTVSKLCSSDQSEIKENTKENLNSKSFQYEDLIVEVSRLHDFIPSLLALEEKVIEEVSTSLIVKEVMDIMIARPFVATVVFCDAIFLFFMIFGFRAAVNGMIMGGELENVLRWIYVVSNCGVATIILKTISICNATHVRFHLFRLTQVSFTSS